MHSQSKSGKREAESRRVRIFLAAISVVTLSSSPADAFNLIGARCSAPDLRIAARSDDDRKDERGDRSEAGERDAERDSGRERERDGDRKNGRDDEPKVDRVDGWNSSKDEKREPQRDGWERGGKRSGDVFEAGDTALSAGKYMQAFSLYREEAHKLSMPGKGDAGTQAMLFERAGNAARLAGRFFDAESMLKQAAGHCGTDRALASSKARILFELADLLSFEGIPDDASISIDQARKALVGLGDKNASVDAELSVLSGRLLSEQCRFAEAEKDFQNAQRALDQGELSRDSLPPATPISKSNEQLAGKLAANRAILARSSGNNTAAAQLEADAAAKLERSYGRQGPADVEDHRYLPEVLKLRSQLTSLPADQGKARYDSALAAVPAGAGYAKAALMLEYGRYQFDAEDFKGSEATFQAAADLLQKVAPAKSYLACAAQLGLAECYLNALKIKSATRLGQLAYSKLERTNGLNSKAFADAAAIVGRGYVAAGQYGPGEVNLHKAIRIYDKTIGKGTYERARASESLAVVNLRNRKYQVALDLATSSLQTEERLFGANSPRLVPNLTTMGNASAHLKKYADADRQFARGQSILLRAGKGDTPLHADVISGIGINAALQKKWGPAEASFKKAMAIYARTQGPRSAGTLAVAELLKTMRNMRDGGPLLIQNALLQGNFVPKRPDQQQ